MEERRIQEYWISDEESLWYVEEYQSLDIREDRLDALDTYLDEFETEVNGSPLPTTIDRIVTEFQKKIKTNGKSPEQYVKEYQNTQDPEEKKKLKEIIAAHYIRMLAKIAIKIAQQYQIPDDLYPDLLNESILVLHKCLNNYDPNRGVKFSSYLYRAAFSGIKRSILTKFHLVRDKSYLHKYSEKDETDKYEYIRLEEAALTKISYELSSEKISREINARTFIEKFMKEIPWTTRQLLLKIMKGEKLTQVENQTFKKLKPHLLRFLKEKFGVTSLDDII